jgi:hypothetical protein
MNTNTTSRITTEKLNEAIRYWKEALAARRLTKAAMDATYASYASKKATYEEVAAAYDADYAAITSLQAAHAYAQSLYIGYNAQSVR